VIDDFPLFVLGIVALPHEPIPLHVFEERYRAMIERCLETDGEFGIVWADEGGERGVGCACAVAQVLRRHDDGRLDILATGTRPLRIVERHDTLSWPAATVELLDDAPEQPDPLAATEAHAAYARLVRAATDQDPDPAALTDLSAYAMAATVDFAHDAKQGLLELRSENARLRLITQLLRDELTRQAEQEQAATSARTNGKVHRD
jgi:Lon protease-like protein